MKRAFMWSSFDGSGLEGAGRASNLTLLSFRVRLSEVAEAKHFAATYSVAGIHPNYAFLFATPKRATRDEVGRLTRARRWDLSVPDARSAPIPDTNASVDLTYAYDHSDARVIKTASDEALRQSAFGVHLRRARTAPGKMAISR